MKWSILVCECSVCLCCYIIIILIIIIITTTTATTTTTTGATAFATGGIEAEKEAKRQYRESIQEAKKNETLIFREWQAKQRELRRQEKAEGRSMYT